MTGRRRSHGLQGQQGQPGQHVHRRHPGRRLQGLTLIELMVGLAICAILVSLAVPSFQSYLQRNRLKSAVQGLDLDLREARYEAARRGQPLHLAYRPGSDWCYAITTTADCDCHFQQACRLKTVRAKDLRGVQLLESQNARFDPASGQTDVAGATAVWQAGGPERVRVSLTPMGRPALCMIDGTLPPFAAC
jgi:type IV fimbrial biogenesis protein FimT